MVQVIVEHKVKDFDAWLPQFVAHGKVRKAYGCEGATVHRSLQDPDDVVIVLRWATAASFDRFVKESDLKEAMQQAGVVSEPRIVLATDHVAAAGGAVAGEGPGAALVRRYTRAVFEQGDLDRVDALYAKDYVNHTNPPGVPAGPEGVRALRTAFRTAFPDARATIEHVVEDGDKVTWHVLVQGTHKGDLMGIPATGRKATWRAIAVDRIEDGRFAERWEVFDLHGLLAQLGVGKAPA